MILELRPVLDRMKNYADFIPDGVYITDCDDDVHVWLKVPTALKMGTNERLVRIDLPTALLVIFMLTTYWNMCLWAE